MPECEIYYQCPCCGEVLKADLHAVVRQKLFIKRDPETGDIDTIETMRIETAYLDNEMVVHSSGDKIDPKEAVKLKQLRLKKVSEEKSRKKLKKPAKKAEDSAEAEKEDDENVAKRELGANRSS